MSERTGDRLGGPLRLLLLIPLLQPVGDGVVRIPTLILCGLGLVFPRALRRPEAWLALALLGSGWLVWDWPLPDNHLYLLVYAQVAVALALVCENPTEALARSARLLVGTAFALALVWKLLLSPDYTDGTFFRVTLLDDGRFEPVALSLGGLSRDELDAARSALRQHVDGPIARETVAELPPQFHTTADALTLWTLSLELLVAVGFLWPLRSGPGRLRDSALLTFCATTFAFATVAGFGWLLCALGLAQCDPGRRWTRAAYLAVFALVLVYSASSLVS